MKEKPEEIINSLLKGNIECIKDESLDIDLSVCAPIPSATNNSILSDIWPEYEINLTEELRKNGRKPTFSRRSSQASELSDNERKTNVYDGLHLEYKCSHCVEFFDALEDLVAHENTHKISFKCDECSKQFINKSSLKSHLKSHKNTRKDSMINCPDCGKQLKLGSMWMHRKIHNDNKRYSCDICGQKFVQKINLINHTKMHKGERPYECPECQKSFTERFHLVRHQRYHTSTRQYKCEKCGKMYKTERCLKVHNLVHLEQRPFVCTECNKSFISSSKLKQHSNIHTGERPYKCKYCSRDFTNFPNWLKHTRRRHKVDHKTGEELQDVPNYGTKQKQAKSIKIKQEPPASSEIQVKKEPTFNDIYNMSLNSAEDLIMEQALEMEESVYATSPANSDPNAFCNLAYTDSPFSSPSSSYHYSSPLSSATMTTSNFFSTTHPTLPSVETLFASSLQKTFTNT